jgi:hypothetical protein
MHWGEVDVQPESMVHSDVIRMHIKLHIHTMIAMHCENNIEARHGAQKPNHTRTQP